MADYVLRGTRSLVRYTRTLGINMNTQKERIAAAVGIPVIHLQDAGRDPATYTSPRYSEAKAQALAGILGVEVTDVTTNGGQEIVG